MNLDIQTISYSLAGLAFLVLSVLLMTRWRGRIHSRSLTAGSSASALWGAALAGLNSVGTASAYQLFFVEMFHGLVWILLLSALLGGSAGLSRRRIARYGGVALATLILLLVDLVSSGAFQNPISPDLSRSLFAMPIVTSLTAIVILEQIYRNSRASQRSVMKFCISALG